MNESERRRFCKAVKKNPTNPDIGEIHKEINDVFVKELKSSVPTLLQVCRMRASLFGKIHLRTPPGKLAELEFIAGHNDELTEHEKQTLCSLAQNTFTTNKEREFNGFVTEIYNRLDE